jgi:hypothetical protein
MLSRSAVSKLFEQSAFRTAFLGCEMGFMSGADIAMISTAKSDRGLSNWNAYLFSGHLH